MNLASNPKKKSQFKKLLNIGEKAFKKLFDKKGYKPEDLFKNSEYQALANSTAELFNTAIPHHTPEDLKAYLEQDIFIFSQLKTHTQLMEARQYLKDGKGNIRSYHDFEQNVLKLNKRYNLNYLEAEYEFATHSAMSASNWANLQEDTGRYWLEYRTAGDDRVRVSHQGLHGVCLPKDDAFWSEFYPPNGWRCFEPDTLILTVEGWKPIKDIKRSDYLIGGSGNKRFVGDVISNNFSGDLVTLFSKRKNLSCTPNHRFITQHGWIDAESINTGDIIIQVGKVGFFNKISNAVHNSIVLIQYGFMSLKRKWKTIRTLNINN
ncbi:hypothetical protein GO491_03180 [Flavobacteriaceae bacterium Ap0902]|nr:hypothetical protein [Flavobacteriaceae bacterium Ap0902]